MASVDLQARFPSSAQPLREPPPPATDLASRAAGARGYVVAVRPIEFFRPSEEVDAHHVRQLAEQVQRSGHWLAPLPVEAASGLVMDGNHRLQVAHLLGLRRLPCIPLHYDDRRLRVQCWKTGRPFSLDELRAIVSVSGVLPYKTTRHSFDPPLPESEIPLLLLGDDTAARWRFARESKALAVTHCAPADG